MGAINAEKVYVLTLLWGIPHTGSTNRVGSPSGGNGLMKQVLFVDTRNSILGPMAEALFNRNASGLGVATSGGILFEEWINARVVLAMYEVGIDIGHKLPREVDARMLAQADTVVRMGVDLQVSDLIETRDWVIGEPANPSFLQVCDLRDQIRRRVDRLLEDIRKSNQTAGLTDLQWRTAVVNLLSM